MKTQEISLISCDRVPSDQEIHERSSGNIIAQMPFDHQGTEVLVLTAEHAEVIWNLCITGLPIEQLVAYTVGMYTSYISTHLIVAFTWHGHPSQAFFCKHSSQTALDLQHIFLVYDPRPRKITNTVLQKIPTLLHHPEQPYKVSYHFEIQAFHQPICPSNLSHRGR